MDSTLVGVLADAKALFKKLRAEHSTDLPDVIDRAAGVVVPSWRTLRDFRDHPLHRMMSRVGGFPPALARYFVALYSKPGEVVLDPFCGKGTALLEALMLGRFAVGGDLAPDAVVVSRAKCSSVTVAEVARYIEALALRRDVNIGDVPRDVALFFSRNTLLQLVSVRDQVLVDMGRGRQRKVATFVCGVLLGILHGHSKLALSLPCNQAFGMAPNYVRRYVAAHKLERPKRDVRECLLMKSLELLPAPRLCGEWLVAEQAAQSCREYVGGAFDFPSLILTSPPYMNRQTYIKDSWLRLWLLGRNRESLLPGSMETGNVRTFLEGTRQSLEAMVSSLRPNGRIVLVCGRANLRLAGQEHPVRVADLCLYAINNTERLRASVAVERLIIDRKLMIRGSYFAVHAGKTRGDSDTPAQRYGEDEILVLKKQR